MRGARAWFLLMGGRGGGGVRRFHGEGEGGVPLFGVEPHVVFAPEH